MQLLTDEELPQVVCKHCGNPVRYKKELLENYCLECAITIADATEQTFTKYYYSDLIADGISEKRAMRIAKKAALEEANLQRKEIKKWLKNSLMHGNTKTKYSGRTI